MAAGHIFHMDTRFARQACFANIRVLQVNTQIMLCTCTLTRFAHGHISTQANVYTETRVLHTDMFPTCKYTPSQLFGKARGHLAKGDSGLAPGGSHRPGNRVNTAGTTTPGALPPPAADRPAPRLAPPSGPAQPGRSPIRSQRPQSRGREVPEPSQRPAWSRGLLTAASWATWV